MLRHLFPSLHLAFVASRAGNSSSYSALMLQTVYYVAILVTKFHIFFRNNMTCDFLEESSIINGASLGTLVKSSDGL